VEEFAVGPCGGPLRLGGGGGEKNNGCGFLPVGETLALAGLKFGAQGFHGVTQEAVGLKRLTPGFFRWGQSVWWRPAQGSAPQLSIKTKREGSCILFVLDLRVRFSLHSLQSEIPLLDQGYPSPPLKTGRGRAGAEGEEVVR